MDKKEQARRSDTKLSISAHRVTLHSCPAGQRSLFPGQERRGPRHQRGWLGLVGLLLALVIVAVLAQKVLKTNGLLPGAGSEAKSAAERGTRGPGATSPAPLDETVATPTPAAALERARGLESAVQQQAQDLNKRIDDTEK